jgi:hypothetical protein
VITLYGLVVNVQNILSFGEGSCGKKSRRFWVTVQKSPFFFGSVYTQDHLFKSLADRFLSLYSNDPALLLVNEEVS